MTVFAADQQVQIGAGFDHIWRAPFAGYRDVVAEMPPEIITEILRTAIDFPAAENVEALVIEQEDSAWTAAIGSAECAHVDRVGAAMNRMWPAISRTRRDFLGL